MSISARNIFNYDSLLSKRIQLDNREYQIRQRERDLIGQVLAQRSAQPDQQSALIRSQRFFELGFEEGFKRAQAGETEVPDLGGLFSIFAGALLRGNVRAKGGPVKKGEPYVVGEKGPELIVPSESGNVIPNDEVKPYFEASIGREDARNLKSNIITDSFFDTGKGRSSDFYEEKTSDGTTLFSSKTEMIGSSISKSKKKNYSNEETFDDGSAETLNETETLESRSLNIGIPDIIEHKDQLLGEIHKIKGFENVTIEDVLQGRTGLPRDTMFNILANSDASYATAAKKAEAVKLDKKARGFDKLVDTEGNITKGTSTYGENARKNFLLDEGDEVSQSLKGTKGYRSGQINPNSIFISDDSFESESTKTYNSEGLVKGDTENNEYSNLASSINQSVGADGVKTVIQPVIQNQITQVPTPVPIAQPVGGNVTRMRRSELPNNIAKLIQ